MNQFQLQQGRSNELAPFPWIIEFTQKKNQTVQLRSLEKDKKESIRFYYIVEGKFEWTINEQHHVLYPGDMALVLPGQIFGGDKSFLDIGTVCRLDVQPEQFDAGGRMR